MTNAVKIIILILVFISGAFIGVKFKSKPTPPPPPEISQNQGVQVSCVEVETTKPDGTKTREIKFSSNSSQKQEFKPTPQLFKHINYSFSFIPNWNFETNSTNYALTLEKRIVGELFAGAYVNLSERYQIKNAGGSLRYGF